MGKNWSAFNDTLSRQILIHFVRWSNAHPQGFSFADAMEDPKLKVVRPAAYAALKQNLDAFAGLLKDAIAPNAFHMQLPRSPLAPPDLTPVSGQPAPLMMAFGEYEQIPELLRQSALARGDGTYLVPAPPEVMAALNPNSNDGAVKAVTPQKPLTGESPFRISREDARDLNRYRLVKARAELAGQTVTIAD
jgi:hypothetical protein